MSTDPIELHEAYVWDCPECGRENIVRPYNDSLDHFPDAELAEMIFEGVSRETPDLGIRPEDVHFSITPDSVKCRHCKSEFPTFSLDDEIDDD